MADGARRSTAGRFVDTGTRPPFRPDGDGRVGQGALRINNVAVPGPGTYALTSFYVNPNNDPTRSVIITASGSGSVSLTVAGSAACCSAQQVRVDLNRGPNSITFSNPAGHAPAIDRTVVRPP